MRAYAAYAQSVDCAVLLVCLAAAVGVSLRVELLGKKASESHVIPIPWQPGSGWTGPPCSWMIACRPFLALGHDELWMAQPQPANPVAPWCDQSGHPHLRIHAVAVDPGKDLVYDASITGLVLPVATESGATATELQAPLGVSRAAYTGGPPRSGCRRSPGRVVHASPGRVGLRSMNAHLHRNRAKRRSLLLSVAGLAIGCGTPSVQTAPVHSTDAGAERAQAREGALADSGPAPGEDSFDCESLGFGPHQAESQKKYPPPPPAACLPEGTWQSCAMDGLCCAYNPEGASEKDIYWVSALSDGGCRASYRCRLEGRCFARCGMCVALDAVDCAESANCGRWAACTLSNGHCVVTDESCALSVLCRARGWCRAEVPQTGEFWRARCVP